MTPPSTQLPARPRLSVGFILAPRFTLSAFANFVDVLRLAADDGDGSRPILCGWRLLSATMAAITSSCGIAVQPDERLGDPSRFDYIVVVGGLVYDNEVLNPDCMKFLRRAADADVPLVGLCTGAFILHRAGLMKGRRCCVSWFHHDDFLEQFAGMEPVSDRIFVVDGNRLTCAGGASSAHLAAYLVDKHVGPAQARKSLHIMIIDEAMAGRKAQPGIPLELETKDELVKRALLFMQQSTYAPPSMSAVAEHLHVGRRKLERHFRNALGITPAAADRLIRVKRAKLLLHNTNHSITAIAAEAGFYDATHLIKIFKEHYGVTPDAFRASAGAE